MTGPASAGWTPALVIALAAVVVTGIAALGTNFTQLVIDRRAADRKERKERYDELVKVYDDLLESFTNAAAVRTMHAMRGISLEDPDEVQRVIDQEGSMGRGRLLLARMSFHGAPDEVLQAAQAVVDAITEPVADGRRHTAAEVNRSEAPFRQALTVFIQRAREHARSMLEPQRRGLRPERR